MNYDKHGKMSTKHPWRTNEMNKIPQITGPGKVFVTVTAASEAKEVGWFLGTGDRQL